jgi:hypothetical protein
MPEQIAKRGKFAPIAAVIPALRFLSSIDDDWLDLLRRGVGLERWAPRVWIHWLHGRWSSPELVRLSRIKSPFSPPALIDYLMLGGGLMGAAAVKPG